MTLLFRFNTCYPVFVSTSPPAVLFFKHAVPLFKMKRPALCFCPFSEVVLNLRLANQTPLAPREFVKRLENMLKRQDQAMLLQLDEFILFCQKTLTRRLNQSIFIFTTDWTRVSWVFVLDKNCLQL